MRSLIFYTSLTSPITVKQREISFYRASSQTTNIICEYEFTSVYSRLLSPFLSVRNHGGVPDIDENVYELEIAGLVNKPIKISLKDLKDPEKFP